MLVSNLAHHLIFPLIQTVKRHHTVQDGGEAHKNRAYEPVPPLRAILTEPVLLSILNFLWLSFLDMALRALQPLFFATPTRLGGLGMSPSTIGLCLGIVGPLDAVVQGFFFAKIVKRLGLKKLLLTNLLCFIPLAATFPVISSLAQEWGLSPVVWFFILLQFMMNCVTDMSFGG